MKRNVILMIILASLMFVYVFPAFADDNMCTVTWYSGEAAYFSGFFDIGEENVKTTTVQYGHIITADDLPYVASYAKTSDKYHYEWTGAIGTRITEDVSFTLNWVSNYDGYNIVIWKSSLLPNFRLINIEGRNTELAEFFCDIEMYENNHVITKSDIEKHSHYENAVRNQSYYFEWDVKEGFTVLDNNSVFHYNCLARDDGFVPVIWNNTSYDLSVMLAGDTEWRHAASYQYSLAEVFPKGYVLKSDDLPTMHMLGNSTLYSYVWDGALGCKLEETTSFCIEKSRNEKAQVRFYLDGELVHDETVPVGTRVTLPEVIDGHEEMRIYGWTGESGAGFMDCEVGEVVEINFDILFDAKCLLWGDITHDGITNTQDAVSVLKRIARDETFKVLERLAADMDKNNEVTTRDAVLILQYVASK